MANRQPRPRRPSDPHAGMCSCRNPPYRRVFAVRDFDAMNDRPTTDTIAAIDDGIVLAFPGPHSFTGEDVAELQAHGSPVLLRRLVERCCELGARQARPGEFSERAFLNGQLDLVQAEAIADLIAASDLRA